MQDSIRTDDTGYMTEPDMLVSTESDIDLKDISSYGPTRVDMSQSKYSRLLFPLLPCLCNSEYYYLHPGVKNTNSTA